MIRGRIAILFIIIGFQLTFAQYNTDKLNLAISTFKNDPALKNASWGFCLYDPETKQIVSSYNEDRSLIPASTTKLLTTGSALTLIGENFTWKTEIAYSGTIDSNFILQGDLYIIGGGDPTLGSGSFGAMNMDTLLQTITTSVLLAGIDGINGKIIADVSIFKENEDIIPPNWTWQDMANGYCAYPSALSVFENTYSIIFKTGNKAGDTTCILKTIPLVEDLELINNVLTADKGTGDQTYIYGGPYSNRRIVSGTLPAQEESFAIKGAIPNPPKLLLGSLIKKFKAACINVTGGVEVRDQLYNIAHKSNLVKKTSILMIESPALKDVMYFTNQTSSNYYAEHLLKTIGLVKGGEGSTKEGIRQVKKFLYAINFNEDGFVMDDGSGLSRVNVITPYHQVQYLAYFLKHSKFNLFYESLPLAGYSGTLRKMFIDSPLQGNLRAKTGTLSNVKALAGYITDKNGKKLCFSLLINNFGCSINVLKKKMEQLLNPIAEF